MCRRLFDLLFDETHETSTSEYGVDPKLTAAIQELLGVTATEEMQKAITLTKAAQNTDRATNTSKYSQKELTEYESGDKLHQLHEFVISKVCKHISPTLVSQELLTKADVLGKKVTADRRARNWQILKQLSGPVWCLLVQIIGLVVLRSALMSVFHQLAAWCSPIEAAVAGKCYQALSHCLTSFLSLLCLTCSL